MNRQKGKTALILLVAVLCAIVLLGIRGTRKTIDKTVPARVYEDNSTTYATSSITISGHAQKDVVLHQLCRDLCHGRLRALVQRRRRSQDQLGDNEYPILTFFYAGNFSQLDVKSIDIDKDMDRIMITLNDGRSSPQKTTLLPAEAMNGN